MICTYLESSPLPPSPPTPLYILFIAMRKLLRSSYLPVTRSAVPEYRPEANEQKLKSWWSRLNSLSSRPASKVYLAQLSNLLAYYNRQVTDSTKVVRSPRSPSTSPPGTPRSSPRTSCRA
jgi:hypothetical protein